MNDNTKDSTFGDDLPRRFAKGRMNHRKIIIVLIMAILLPLSSYASTCGGRFVNPISDICWSCLLPISIGSPPTGVQIGKGSIPKKRDTKNPSSPLCLCTKAGVPVPGISIGFWEPVRLVDITRTPYCMVNLGGLQLASGSLNKVSSYARGYGDHHAHRLFVYLPLCHRRYPRFRLYP